MDREVKIVLQELKSKSSPSNRHSGFVSHGGASLDCNKRRLDSGSVDLLVTTIRIKLF